MLKILRLIIVVFLFINNIFFFFFSFFFLLFFWSLLIYCNLLRRNFINLFFFSDSLSSILRFLSFWICLLVITGIFEVYKSNYFKSLFLFLNLLICFFLILRFNVRRIIFFFVIFESILIPTVLIILIWGNQPERLQASYYFLIYTVLASVPLIIIILIIFNLSGRFYFYFLIEFNILKLRKVLISLGLRIAFLVKFPIYGVHLWLPKAHVEAPVGGSIYLAGLLLKLGVYGVYRFFYLKLWIISSLIAKFIRISLVGGCLTGFICLFQFDLKILVAYASVGHIGLVLCAFCTGRIWGWRGGLLMLISHGLASSGLFCFVNMLYEIFHSRSLVFIKGLLIMFPSLRIFCFILCSCNIAAPPTLNLLSEIFLISSISIKSFFIIIFLRFSRLLCVCYSIFFFSQLVHGKFRIFLLNILNLNQIQIFNLFLHLFPIFSFIFFPLCMISW